MAFRKKCPYSEFFWTVFSRIRTEYREMRSIPPYSVRLNTERCGVSLRIQSKCGKKRTRKTPNTNRHCTCLAQWSKPVLGSKELLSTAEKMKFSIKDFFSIHDKNRNFLWTQSHLLKKSLIENIFYAEYFSVSKEHFAIKRQIKKNTYLIRVYLKSAQLILLQFIIQQ